MSTPKDSRTKPPSAQDIDSILQLFKYRNIAWRYLLCYCLPLQQKILIKQLRIAHHRKSSLSAERRKSLEQKKAFKSSILIGISSLFENDQKDLDGDDDDDDIPDFYHLPRISLKELQTLFDEGRQKYELLKKVYITEKQQNIRNDMLRATAPPSEQYNDPSLRTRSDTITALIEHEDKNSNKIFSRIDLIHSDWKSQETMNKLNQLRSTPPAYSPPKPPPFIHRNNFEGGSISTRKNMRTRFNTFTGDKLTRKKQKKSPKDIFKMKVFQSKANNFDSTLTDEMVEVKTAKRRFSELKSSFSPFSALSKTGKKKKNRRRPPVTPPPALSRRQRLQKTLDFSATTIAKTPPLAPTQSTPLIPSKTKQIRSKSPGVFSRTRLVKSEENIYHERQATLKNPKSDMVLEDTEPILVEHHEYFSDDDVLKLQQMSSDFGRKRQRSLSEDDIKYNQQYANKQEASMQQLIATKSATTAMIDTAPFVKAMHEIKQDMKQKEEPLDTKEEEIDNNIVNLVVNVIEDDDDSDDGVGTLLNVTVNDEEPVIDMESLSENKDNAVSVESLVVAAPIHKDKMGTVIVSQKPSRSAPPAQQSHEVMLPKDDRTTVLSSSQNLTQQNETEQETKSEPTSPIVIKLSNTSKVNVVEEYFPDHDEDEEEEEEATKHRGTMVLDTEENDAAAAEENVVQNVFDAEDIVATKPGLFSEDEEDGKVDADDMNYEYVNGKQSPSRSSETNEQSFGQIVLTHPLNINADEDDIDDFEEEDEENDAVSPLKCSMKFTTSDPMTHIELKNAYKRERKSGKRPASMTDFTAHYLRDAYDRHEIEENENKELWKQIMKDVNRTFQYRDFFRKKETRHSLGNLLYIWSRINHQIGYLQGMHDLASIITCAIHFDYKIFNEIDYDDDDDAMQENEILEQLLDPKYLEHDIYAIYDALLQLTVKLFEAAMPPSRGNEDDNDNDDDEEDGAHQNRGLFVSTSNCSLYLKLHYLHHKLLKHFDLNLYTHFEEIGLSPQLYMLRWIRVLFSREFYLDQIITLWDELFVSENLIEFIDYIVMAMIHNVRKELLQKKDMTIIQLLQNYPKQQINIASLAVTARQIQKGQIQFDLVTDNKEFYSHIKSVDKMKDYWQEAVYLFKEVKDYTTFPASNALNPHDLDEYDSYYSYCKGPDIRIPGFRNITQTQKFLVKKIILKSYGTVMPQNNYIRMGYLVKRGSGDQSFFARKNLKIRWFVIDKEQKFSYFKNKKAFENKEKEPLRTPIALKGRAIRVVEAKYFCFEISGISNISKRAYLLFAKDFTDFVLWLHALMWCADKSLYEGM